ncbi:lymphoid tissue lymphoma translocation [Mactra antiquata]
MSQYGLNTTIKLDGSVNDLPVDVFVKIRDELDHNPPDKDWRALACAVENKLVISRIDMERWSPAISNQSAANKLLNSLSTQGMTVGQLRDYLRKIHIDTHKLGLSDMEDVVIIKQPPTDIDVYEGDPLILEVIATGLPFPKYRWFFCPNGANDFAHLQGRTEATLQIDNVSQLNAGTYSCQIYNCMDKKKTKLTPNTLVIVSKNPNPIANGLSPTDLINYPRIATQNGYTLPEYNQPTFMGRHQDYHADYNLIVRQPRDIDVGMNEQFVLVIETQGDPPVFYQWFRHGMPIEGQISPKLSISHATPADFATYYCVVRNGVKTEQSNTVCVKEKKMEKETEIVLISQPQPVHVKFGGCALFSCEARCNEPLRYQWIKNGTPLEGETSSEIRIMNIQDCRVNGMYQCEISVDSPNSSKLRRIFTSSASLKVDVPSVRDNVEYHPSDKVALLIGNAEYKCENFLKGSSVDVKILTEEFRSLDFKVVSLLNLTKPEIENAVLYFCELIEKNVYVVFYFCGHGFEENGLSYLMPTDAPNGYTTEHCVCAQHVLDNIQMKEPVLIWMIMDVCRHERKVKSNGTPNKFRKGKVKGNTVFCYATSEGMAAYEDKEGGFLVMHLKKLLKKNIGIDALIGELKEEFNAVRRHSDRQIPELRSNLLEPRRSLVDKISTKGQAEAYHLREERLRNMWEKPTKKEIKIGELGAVIELDFQAEFANVLAIFVIVTNPGTTDECIAQITNFTPPVTQPVSQYEKPLIFQRNRCTVTKTVLQDLQKLKEQLSVDVSIKVTMNGKQRILCTSVGLGFPLMSRFKLWEQSKNFIPYIREGIEQSED